MAGPWGGYSNGNIPLSALVAVSTKPDYLEPHAAAAWGQMNAQCLKDTGYELGIASGSSAYRSMSDQVAMKAERGSAAADPGKSDHGWGQAIDYLNYTMSIVANWVNANARKYGWSTAEGKSFNEAWHLTYDGPMTGTVSTASAVTGQPSANLFSSFTAIGGVLGFLTNGKNWQRIGIGLLGAILLSVALWHILKSSSIGKTATNVAKKTTEVAVAATIHV